MKVTCSRPWSEVTIMNVLDFAARKRAGTRLSMVTCYDYVSACVLDTTPIDCLLVGDSVAMVMHGHPSTVHADVEMMALHTRAVSRGAPNKFIVADLPFLAVRKGLIPTMDAVQQLMQSGAHAVKIEGAVGQLDVMAHIVESGVPVMGHLGLTPQSVHTFGGHRVQGRDRAGATRIIDDARHVTEAGCFALVLECVPGPLAAQITRQVAIPTIGIGAGAGTDGQVLVLHDLLGLQAQFKPRFVRHYTNGFATMADAVSRFHADVTDGSYPSCSESYA
jgi:3-methyl-2-oxobutanoate hydroxymethyltransferase